jgi:hypothetical protein
LLASLEGDNSGMFGLFATRPDAPEGVDGRNPSPFLTGSVLSSFVSNMDIREFIGAIDVVSVKSRVVTELATLWAPTLPLRLALVAAC